MIRHYKKTGLVLAGLLAASLIAGLGLRAATTAPAKDDPTDKSAARTSPPEPGPNDGHIAYVAAKLLERYQYLEHPLDDKFSSKFLDRYLETLDPQRLHFTEADLAEFEPYRFTLDDLTVQSSRGMADTRPGFKIFARFLQRLEQRVAYVDALLKNEQFTFDADESILVNRKDEPNPRDLDEAKKLWRERLRFEYLQEKLGQANPKKTAAKPANTNAPTTEIKKTPAEEIVDTLGKRYHRNLKSFKEWDHDDVLQIYLTALAHVYDPHSDYMNQSQAENFAIGMNLALFGIGAVLTTDLDGYCKILELKPGPAMKSKQIKVGDRIVAVAQGGGTYVDVVEMNLNKVVQLIRGEKGTQVRLKFIPVDDSTERREVALIRDEIKLEDQEAKARVIDLPNGDGKTTRIGVIDLPSFYATFDLPGNHGKSEPRSTSADVARLLKKLKEEGVNGVVLDLRRNGGGSLEEAIRLTGLFIKKGPVVQVRGAKGDPLVDEDKDDSIAYDGPLLVLTSRFSASASEILAGALQDYGRALIVGDISTHGKGTVQNLNPLRQFVPPKAGATNDPGALKMTIRKFYRAGGASTQLKGVMPDIVLPSVWNYSKDIGEVAQENALPWDTIASASFDRLNLVQPYLNELLKRSNERVATNQDFSYVREDIEQYRKAQADKTVSLNEKARLKEKEEAEARQKARDKERLARNAPQPKIYELTLSKVDLPGLPAPIEKTNSTTANASTKPPGGFPIATNSVSVTGTGVPATNPLQDVEEDAPPPAADAAMDEAQQILEDYILLLAQKGLLTATK